MSDKQTDWLAKRHPDYHATLPQWQLNHDSYVGGVQYYNSGHLFQYSRVEGDDTYKERCARAARRNFFARIVETIVGYLGSSEAARNPNAPPAVLNFRQKPCKDSDDTIATYMLDIARWLFGQGMIAVVVDQDAVAYETKAQEVEAGHRPYSYIVLPAQIADYSIGKDGKLNWLKLIETYRNDDDPQTADDGVQTQYRIWYRDKWQVWRYDNDRVATLHEEGENRLGQVPARIYKFMKGSSAWQGATPMDDVARLDRAIFNLESELDEIGCRYTFSQLWIRVADLLANQMMSNAANQDLGTKAVVDFGLALGRNEVLVVTGEGNGPGAGYIAPDASQGELILKMIDNKAKAIYQLLALQDETSEKVGTPMSGESKKRDFVRLDAMLRKFAKVLENIEWTISDLANQWQGGAPGALAEDASKWPDTFDVSALADDLNEVLQLDDLFADSPTAQLLFRTRLLDKWAAGTEDTVEQTMLEMAKKELKSRMTSDDEPPEEKEKKKDEE